MTTSKENEVKTCQTMILFQSLTLSVPWIFMPNSVCGGLITGFGPSEIAPNKAGGLFFNLLIDY